MQEEPHLHSEIHKLPGVAPYYRRNSIANPLPLFIQAQLSRDDAASASGTGTTARGVLSPRDSGEDALKAIDVVDKMSWSSLYEEAKDHTDDLIWLTSGIRTLARTEGGVVSSTLTVVLLAVV